MYEHLSGLLSALSTPFLLMQTVLPEPPRFNYELFILALDLRKYAFHVNPNAGSGFSILIIDKKRTNIGTDNASFP